MAFLQVTALGHLYMEPDQNLMLFLEFVMTLKLYILSKEMVHLCRSLTLSDASEEIKFMGLYPIALAV